MATCETPVSLASIPMSSWLAESGCGCHWGVSNLEITQEAESLTELPVWVSALRLTQIQCSDCR